MSDGKKERVRFVVGGERSRHVDDSEAAPNVGVPITCQFPLLPILNEPVVGEEARRHVKVQRLTNSQKSSPLVGLSQLLESVSQRASLLKGSWESWSHFGDRDYFGHGWTTDMLVFKFLNNF